MVVEQPYDVEKPPNNNAHAPTQEYTGGLELHAGPRLTGKLPTRDATDVRHVVGGMIGVEVSVTVRVAVRD